MRQNIPGLIRESVLKVKEGCYVARIDTILKILKFWDS